MQGLHNLHGNFNVPNMPGALGSRSTTMNNIASSGLQQASGNLSTGRFASNNLPVALSQISHSNTHVHSGMASRGGMNVIGNQGYSSSTNGVGGSIPGILPTSAAIGNRTSVPGLGVSPVLGNAGQRITSSMGSIVGGGNIGRNISSGGSITHFQDFVVDSILGARGDAFEHEATRRMRNEFMVAWDGLRSKDNRRIIAG